MTNIIVPLDLSDPSLNALKYAVEMVKDKKVLITLFHAVDFPAPAGKEYDIAMSEIENGQLIIAIKESEERLKEIIKTLPKKNITYTTLVEMGPLTNWVHNYLPNLNPDLVVMGTKGASGIKSIIIGSNTEKAVRFACCPVLAIPEESSWNPVSNIVVPFDLDEATDGFLNALKEIQESINARLQFVWVKTVHSLKNEEVMKKEIVNRLSSVGIINYHVEIRRSFSISNSLIKYVDEIKGDLIAMPTHGRKGIMSLFVDSVTEDLVNHSKIPIWTYNINMENEEKQGV